MSAGRAMRHGRDIHLTEQHDRIRTRTVGDGRGALLMAARAVNSARDIRQRQALHRAVYLQFPYNIQTARFSIFREWRRLATFGRVWLKMAAFGAIWPSLADFSEIRPQPVDSTIGRVEVT